jgi:hypothetical protein
LTSVDLPTPLCPNITLMRSASRPSSSSRLSSGAVLIVGSPKGR